MAVSPVWGVGEACDGLEFTDGEAYGRQRAQARAVDAVEASHLYDAGGFRRWSDQSWESHRLRPFSSPGRHAESANARINDRKRDLSDQQRPSGGQ